MWTGTPRAISRSVAQASSLGDATACNRIRVRFPYRQGECARRGVKVCAEPGCPQLRPCPVHKPKQPDRPSPASLGYDSRWRRKSAEYRAAHPTCEQQGCVMPSECVDHIDGLGPAGPRGFDDSNLMAMCWSCHSRKTALFDGAFGNPSKRGGGREISAG